MANPLYLLFPRTKEAALSTLNSSFKVQSHLSTEQCPRQVLPEGRCSAEGLTALRAPVVLGDRLPTELLHPHISSSSLSLATSLVCFPLMSSQEQRKRSLLRALPQGGHPADMLLQLTSRSRPHWSIGSHLLP